MATAEIILPLLGGIRNIVNPPGIGWQGPKPYLTFDGTTDEVVTWSLGMPENYASGLKVKVHFSMVSATTGVVALRSQIMAVSDGGLIDTDASYDTLEKSSDVTVPGTAGNKKTINFSLTNIDGLIAGDYLAIQLGRENATTGTNATGDMAVWAISLIYTTT